MRELDKVLDSNEKVIWEGTPKFLPYLFGTVLFGSLARIIMFLFFLPFLLMFLMPFYMIIFLLVFGFLKTIGVSFAVATGISLFSILIFYGFIYFVVIPIFVYLSYRNLYFAITDKRVILQSGIIGRDFKMADFDQISNAEVDVGIFDKIFGGKTGSISVYTPGNVRQTRYGTINVPHKLANILDPYEVFKFFKKASFDVKTDISYPNKMRPKTNPGYNTQYK
ncbi:MAG: PH domain-containing protein [Nanoarchaeota archaeon]